MSYSKHTWYTGEVITATNLNNIESGLELHDGQVNDLIDEVAINTTNILSKTDLAQAAEASMSSTKYIDLSLGESGSTYTAPESGYFKLIKVAGAANQQITLSDATGAAAMQSIGLNQGYWLSSYIPIKKGNTLSVDYTASGETIMFRFYYAEGVKPND